MIRLDAISGLRASALNHSVRAVCAVAFCAGLAACDANSRPARSLSDPAVQKLYALPLPDYAGTARLAQQIGKSCPRYRFDSGLYSKVNEKRNKEGRGSTAARTQSGGVDVMTSVLTREFQSDYGVTVGQSDLCTAADQEAAKNTALAALLAPAR
ncbi:MAG: hypothetical protein ABJI96_15380 [Paracoccaceae bacterium]